MKSLSMLPLALLIGATTALNGCKLSDLADSDDEGGSVMVLQGRALTGAGPLIGATVDIVDASNKTYRVYANASGYFSLTLDEDEYDGGLQAPVVVRANYDEMEYHSVLCNVVYGEGDHVNVNPVTNYVMDRTALTNTNTLDNWDTAQENYCNEVFNNNFRRVANTFGSNFNLFNSDFESGGAVFAATLADFDPDTFDLGGEVPDNFHIKDGLGSLVLVPNTHWAAHITGTLGKRTVDEAFTFDSAITAEELHSGLEGWLKDLENLNVSISSLAITLSGDGTGEIGTTVTAIMKGKAALDLDGASLISRSFNLTLELKRVDGPVSVPE